MTPEQQKPTPDAAPPTPPADRPWWDDGEPVTFTAEEIEDIERNGLDLSDVIASIIADFELE